MVGQYCLRYARERRDFLTDDDHLPELMSDLKLFASSRCRFLLFCLLWINWRSNWINWMSEEISQAILQHIHESWICAAVCIPRTVEAYFIILEMILMTVGWQVYYSTIRRFKDLTIPPIDYLTIRRFNYTTIRRVDKSTIPSLDYSTIWLNPFEYSTISPLE